MRTATIREAQHHLSKLMAELEKGEEIILTKRGKQVGKLVPLDKPENPIEREVDWVAWAEEQREFLKSMPYVGESIVLEEREGYRW
jgi:prevent-host-death family protein